MEFQDNTEWKFIRDKIRAFEVAEEWVPGIKIIQCTHPFRNLFICSRGLEHFGLTRAFFEHLPAKEYREMVFDPDDADTCLLGITEYEDTSFVGKRFYIRHGRLEDKQEVDLVIVHHLSPDKLGRSRFTLTQIIPVSFQSWAVPKTRRIAGEMAFRKENKTKFSQLTDRNKEVLSLMLRCVKAEEIGEQLFIGINTVNSHKKRIKEVLETNDNWEILRYGLAFDLL